MNNRTKTYICNTCNATRVIVAHQLQTTEEFQYQLPVSMTCGVGGCYGVMEPKTSEEVVQSNVFEEKEKMCVASKPSGWGSSKVCTFKYHPPGTPHSWVTDV